MLTSRPAHIRSGVEGAKSGEKSQVTLRKDQISPGAIVFPGHSPIAGHALLRQDADLPSRSPGATLASRRPLWSPTSTGRGPRKARPPFRRVMVPLVKCARLAFGQRAVQAFVLFLRGEGKLAQLHGQSSRLGLPRISCTPDLGLESGGVGQKPSRHFEELGISGEIFIFRSRSMTRFPTRTTLALPL